MSTQNAERGMVDELAQFYRDYYHEAIGELAQHYPKDSRSLVIDWMDIYSYDQEIAHDLLNHGEEFIEYFEEALRIYDFIPLDVGFEKANVRVQNLGPEQTYDVGQTRADNRGEFLSIRGQVKKKTEVKPKAKGIAFECQRCGTVTNIPQSDGQQQEPHECPACDRQGPFRVDFDQSEMTDHQLIRVQQPPEQTKGGNASSIDVVLEDDIVDVADVGDRVIVSGIFKLSEDEDADKPIFDTYIDGCAVSLEDTDFSEIDPSEYIDEIEAIAGGEYGDPIGVFVDSLAPKIWGYEDEKEAIILQLFGGTKVHYPNGSRDRGDMHILLLGDPGCGKSKILRSVKEIAPRSTYASGKGMSAAGMTAAAVRDDFGDTEWGLEAGALVLADKGVACIDEIDKADEDAISSLHDALESQVIEISKAGINTTLPARTSLLAAGNPKYGRFDHYESIAEQIDLDAPLLSRFDLMFMLKDKPDEDDDSELAGHIVDTRGMANSYTYDDGATDADISDIKPTIPADVMRAYIAYAKQNFHPCVREDQKEDLKEWYVDLRLANSETDGPVPVTARKVEAMCRLAEASARARLSQTVDSEDMRRAGKLVMRAMKDVGTDPDSGEFDADVVETGMSKSQRDRIHSVKDLIGDLESEYDDGVPENVIVDEAMDLGFDREKVQHSIEKLKDRGEVYENRSDHYRLT